MASVTEESQGLINAKQHEDTTPDLEAGPIPAVDSDKGIAVMSVTIRKPITLVSGIAIAYSYLPYLVCLGFSIWFVLDHIIYPLWAALTLITVSLVGEIGLKHIVREPRPENSAVKSYGMPSSHSSTCIGLLFYTVFELLFPFEGVKPHWTALQLTLAVFVTVVALAPVPWARWYLEDHSLRQICVGSALGFIFGVSSYFVRVHFFPGVPLTDHVPLSFGLGHDSH
uniref:Phosphatidic acid phosphatase type 2/haloperoxidase domain-containing protein n=1 Tax=Chromera velia CCMP2878 TaxID=1169474 RepID=A0A0G4IF89_9ALVE|mmetsp:Transcript_52946/g.103553  ORF Transcript_52946/g.103553 Transcript_52946/m.103553 type:complete len:226 (+) Transcript_52946:247-924(+)|eukprot:Cvel_2427.t1-p1 / transcript=Cvel_2427.t1 / gene=Cvel_2427 / organism=Chromera_velia_CCMP2878 / gene_product=hypothetical protein / transcript_product=hypothetical protein / location=Cvel_scaffold95:19875-21905(-) / protein_length=225 / sequence_SO=supercontig / SO=protein_coding / is_pseudo=false